MHAVVRALGEELRDLLICLDDERGRRMGELVNATAQRPSTLTSVVDRLERRGLARRELDPADRRAFRVHLTQDGRAAQIRVREAYADLARRGTDALTEDPAPTCVDVLDALRRASQPWAELRIDGGVVPTA